MFVPMNAVLPLRYGRLAFLDGAAYEGEWVDDAVGKITSPTQFVCTYEYGELCCQSFDCSPKGEDVS